MKRATAFILSALLLLSVSACGKSDAESELERAKKSAEAFKKAADAQIQKSEDLLDLIDEYQDAVAKLENAK